MATQEPDHAWLEPSHWIVGHASLVETSAHVLDVACGYGRHARYFAERGAFVTAVDRDATALQTLSSLSGVMIERRELETDAWPYASDCFDAVVVCNYLWRPTFASMCLSIKSGGVLLYETFMAGNERYGKPSRPDFLLRSNELLALTRDTFLVVAYEEGDELGADGQPFATKQKIAAIRR